MQEEEIKQSMLKAEEEKNLLRNMEYNVEATYKEKAGNSTQTPGINCFNLKFVHCAVLFCLDHYFLILQIYF